MALTVAISRPFNNYWDTKTMSCNGSKRRRYESNVSETSRMSTNTHMTNLSLGSSQDDNNVFNDRRNSESSDTNSANLFGSSMPDRPSNIKTDSREKMMAMRKTPGQRVSFSNDDNEVPNERTREPYWSSENGHHGFISQPTPLPNSRPRYTSYTEGSTNTDHYTAGEPCLNHSMSVPHYSQHYECQCASCCKKKERITRTLVQHHDAQQTYLKSPSVRSLPDSYIHHDLRMPLQHQMYNQRRSSGIPVDTVVKMNAKGDGTYLTPMFRNQIYGNPRSHSFEILDTIPSGDSAVSTLDNRPLPQRPNADQAVPACSDASYEIVQSKKPLVEPSVSSTESSHSQSSKSEKWFSCNKVTVLVILNVILILVVVSAVPVYVSVMVRDQPVPEPTSMPVLQQSQSRNRTCVSCDDLGDFAVPEQLGMEKINQEGSPQLCCLKADTSMMDFIVKMRMVPTATVADDETKNNYGRPILQLKSVDLVDRKIHWNGNSGLHSIMRGGVVLHGHHTIQLHKSGYYFVSTKLAFKPNSHGTLHVQFNVMNDRDKPLCSQSEQLSNQSQGRYVSECNFVHHFSNTSSLYVLLDHVEGLQKSDGQIVLFYLGS